MKDQIINFVRSFVQEDDGAQIVEYALIIAAVSLLLILSLQLLNTTSFATWVNKVGTCLTTAVCN